MVARAPAAVALPGASAEPAPVAGVRWEDVVRSVHRQMRSLVGPSPELEDLAQAALEQVLRALDRAPPRGALSAFTYGVCANVALHHFRSWKRFLRRFELGRPDAADLAPASLADATERIVERERQRRLYRALDRLDANKRIALVLADLEDLPASEVARIVGAPEPTIRSRLRAARAELHAILARDPLFRGEGGRAR